MIFLPMDAMLIEQVLINLMDNAVVHGGNVSQIKINAREEDGKRSSASPTTGAA